MKKLFLIFSLLFSLSSCSQSSGDGVYAGSQYYYYITEAKNLQFCLKNSQGCNYASIENLKSAVESNGNKLLFAMNGGMYNSNGSPVGLYVEKGQELSKKTAMTKCESTNYSMCFGNEPTNGVFFISNNGKALVVKTTQYNADNVKFATQSGPLLLYDGVINPKFSKTSYNLNTRNGVGIMQNGKVVLIIAENISFYNFTCIFKDKFHCQNALYLDGAISKMYIANGDIKDLGGNFGVIIYEEKE